MKIIEYIKNPRKIVFYLGLKGHYKALSDKQFINLMYWCQFGEKINWNNPRSFNEKLQWIKLYGIDQRWQKLVDKAEAKKNVAELIGEEYIIPTLGIWDKFEDIDFGSLPNSFVLKTTHDSGGVVICRDKKNFNIAKARKKINHSLKHNYYWACRETLYKNIPPRIIAEQYIGGSDSNSLDDYKMMCFNGRFDNVLVCEGRYSERGVRFYHFDREWNFLPYVYYDDIDESIFDELRPKNFSKMIEIAETLSQGFPELRVDLYNVNGRIYFGELTFFQAGGFDADFTKEARLILGDKINLPIK